jgi:DnaJ-class molecular chaperone
MVCCMLTWQGILRSNVPRYNRKEYSKYRTPMHCSVRFRLEQEAEGMFRIPEEERCLACRGKGIDTSRLGTLCLLPQFYQCGTCGGTGRGAGSQRRLDLD